jgi:hypothetical protein
VGAVQSRRTYITDNRWCCVKVLDTEGHGVGSAPEKVYRQLHHHAYVRPGTLIILSCGELSVLSTFKKFVISE